LFYLILNKGMRLRCLL